MKSAHKVSVLAVFAFSFFSLISSASAAITVDGLMGDWGVTPGAYGSTDWTPNAGISSTIEDHNPAVDFVGPGWGGQNFDAEALYFKKEGMTAYFALVTGFPLAGLQNESFGDIGFDFDNDGLYEYGVETRGNAGFTKKHLYGNATWNNPTFGISTPYDLKTGTDLGLVGFAYDKTTYVAHKHYILEIGIPISFFGASWGDPNNNPDFAIHWTMSCGNDAIDLEVPGTTTAVPEPATMALFGFGLAGYALKRRKQRAA
jgi:hypothetical protein